MYRGPTVEAGWVQGIATDQVHEVLGPPHDKIEDPRRTASGHEHWWVFGTGGAVIVLCHRLISNDVVVYIDQPTRQVRFEVEQLFGARGVQWFESPVVRP
jgi:hypothetical protein